MDDNRLLRNVFLASQSQNLLEQKNSIVMTVRDGWLCLKKPNNEWLPVFKLTQQQTLEYIQALAELLVAKLEAVPPGTNTNFDGHDI